MEPEKEKWINDVLGSLNERQRVEPSPFLFAKIRNRLIDKPMPVYVSVRALWLTAVLFSLLLLLNWEIISQSTLPKAIHNSDLTTVVSEMQLYPASNQLYDVWSEQNY